MLMSTSVNTRANFRLKCFYIKCVIKLFQLFMICIFQCCFYGGQPPFLSTEICFLILEPLWYLLRYPSFHWVWFYDSCTSTKLTAILTSCDHLYFVFWPTVGGGGIHFVLYQRQVEKPHLLLCQYILYLVKFGSEFIEISTKCRYCMLNRGSYMSANVLLH